MSADEALAGAALEGDLVEAVVVGVMALLEAGALLVAGRPPPLLLPVAAGAELGAAIAFGDAVVLGATMELPALACLLLWLFVVVVAVVASAGAAEDPALAAGADVAASVVTDFLLL